MMHLTLPYFSPKLLYSSADDAAHLLCAIQLLFVVAALLMIWSCGCLLSCLTSPASFAPDASLYQSRCVTRCRPSDLLVSAPASRPAQMMTRKVREGRKGEKRRKRKGNVVVTLTCGVHVGSMVAQSSRRTKPGSILPKDPE